MTGEVVATCVKYSMETGFVLWWAPGLLNRTFDIQRTAFGRRLLAVRAELHPFIWGIMVTHYLADLYLGRAEHPLFNAGAAFSLAVDVWLWWLYRHNDDDRWRRRRRKAASRIQALASGRLVTAPASE